VLLKFTVDLRGTPIPVLSLAPFVGLGREYPRLAFGRSPRGRDRQRQLSRKPAPCQPTTVSGFNSLSQEFKLGRGRFCLSTATCCRSLTRRNVATPLPTSPRRIATSPPFRLFGRLLSRFVNECRIQAARSGRVPIGLQLRADRLLRMNSNSAVRRKLVWLRRLHSPSPRPRLSRPAKQNKATTHQHLKQHSEPHVCVPVASVTP
jgi:hypothetical protein